MKPFSSLCVAFACALLATSANATVTVTFIQPQDFNGRFAPYGLHGGRHDIGDYGRYRVMRELDRHFARLGASLPAGQDLAIEVLDIRLAGRWSWPAVTLRYRLESGGQLLRSGEEQVKDMAPSCNRMPYGEILCAEKQMLNRWFKETLLSAKSGA